MNSEANVMKNDNEAIATEKLSIKERNTLSRLVTGHGKMKNAVRKSGVSKDTIAKAKNGMPVLPQTADKIRQFINSK